MPEVVVQIKEKDCEAVIDYSRKPGSWCESCEGQRRRGQYSEIGSIIDSKCGYALEILRVHNDKYCIGKFSWSAFLIHDLAHRVICHGMYVDERKKHLRLSGRASYRCEMFRCLLLLNVTDYI